MRFIERRGLRRVVQLFRESVVSRPGVAARVDLDTLTARWATRAVYELALRTRTESTDIVDVDMALAGWDGQRGRPMLALAESLGYVEMSLGGRHVWLTDAGVAVAEEMG